MKNKSPHNFKKFLILLFISLFFSCELSKKENNSNSILLAKAEKNSKKQPDSTIAIVNRILNDSSKNSIDDEKKLKLLQLKFHAFSYLKKIDSACITGQKIRMVASRIPDSLAIAETMLRLYGNIDFNYLKEAKPYVQGGIKTFGNRKKEFEKGILLELYGNIMNEEGDYKKSQNYYLKALKIFESVDSTQALSRANNELGVNYTCLGLIEKSNEYYLKALKIAENRKDSMQQSAALQNYGINLKKSNPNKAIEIYQKALQLLPKDYDEMERLRLNYNIANVYFEENKFDEAEKLYLLVMEVATKKNYQDGIMVSNIALGNVYGKKKQFALSESYFLKTLNALEKTDQKNLIFMILPKLISVYEDFGKYKQAYDYSKKLIKIKDDLITVENNKAILDLEKKYQSKKKDLEITNLKKLSSLRHKLIYLLLVSLVIVALLWRNRNKLYLQNKFAYAVLIKKYMEENEKVKPKKINSKIIENELDDTKNVLYNSLVTYYENEKPYLDSKLKAEVVAKKMGVNQREISNVIKKQGFSSFNNFNNKFRVDEVKKCFDHNNYKNIKTEVIANQCGFGSKQPFYYAFEEFTGLNPGFYRSEMSK